MAPGWTWTSALPGGNNSYGAYSIMLDGEASRACVVSCDRERDEGRLGLGPAALRARALTTPRLLLLVCWQGVVRWRSTCATIFECTVPGRFCWRGALNASMLCGVDGTQTVLRNGNILILWSLKNGMVRKTGPTGLAEIVPSTGEVKSVIASTKDLDQYWLDFLPKNMSTLDAYIVNHDVQELPNGHWMVDAFEPRNVTCGNWSGGLVGNELVEFKPPSG